MANRSLQSISGISGAFTTLSLRKASRTDDPSSSLSLHGDNLVKKKSSSFYLAKRHQRSVCTGSTVIGPSSFKVDKESNQLACIGLNQATSYDHSYQEEEYQATASFF
jgi:hypothetical protein